jgi:hypothetical protein
MEDFNRTKEKARKILKQEDTNSRIISGNPVFLPVESNRLGLIPEEENDLLG